MEFRGDAYAGIRHREFHQHVPHQFCRHLDLALRREFQCIGDEVSEDLRELAVVGVEARQITGLFEHQAQLHVVRHGLEHAAQGGKQIHHLEPARRDFQAARLDLGQVEQVVDHLGKLGGGFLDEADLPGLLGGERSIHMVQQQARVAADGAYGRAELMAHVGEEMALEFGGLAQLLGLHIQLAVERDHAAIGLVQLLAQGPDLGAAQFQFSFEIVFVHCASSALRTTTVASSLLRVLCQRRQAASRPGSLPSRPA